MSKLSDLQRRLQALGISLSSEDQVSLEVEGPERSLTHDILTEIQGHKEEILAILQTHPPVHQQDPMNLTEAVKAVADDPDDKVCNVASLASLQSPASMKTGGTQQGTEEGQDRVASPASSPEAVPGVSHGGSGQVSAEPEIVMAPAHEAYRDAVLTVAEAWDAVRADGREPPIVDPAVGDRLDEAIAARFRAGDAAGAIQGIATWRDAWLKLLGQQKEVPIQKTMSVA